MMMNSRLIFKNLLFESLKSFRQQTRSITSAALSQQPIPEQSSSSSSGGSNNDNVFQFGDSVPVIHQHHGQCPFQRKQERPADLDVVQRSCKSFEQIPTPKGLPLVGTLFDLIKAGGAEYLHQYCDKRHRELGPIYREKLGNVDAVFVSDGDLVQQVYRNEGKYPQHMVPEPWIIFNQINGIRRGLFFMDGEEWAEWRSALNKVFLKSDVLNQYNEEFNEVVGDIIKKWTLKMELNRNEILLVDDLEQDLYNWSIESLGTMIFGRRLGCISSKSNELPNIHEFVQCVQQIFAESTNMQLIPPKLAYHLKLPVWKRFEEAANKSLRFASIYVNENARQMKNCDQSEKIENGILQQLMNSGDMDLEEISRIIVDLFIAAADTTSHATQWALYLLSRHENVQDELYQELQNVTNGEPVNEKHLNQLSYVKNIIKESLRLYPVAPFITRYLSDDLDLGGYRVPKGQLVVMSVYTSCRKEEYFHEPNSFLPSRWMRGKDGKNQVSNNFACLPFGLGVRSCIGRRVAEIQMQLFLSKVVQNFKLKSTSEKEIDIKLRMITTPERRIDLQLIKRR